MLAIMRFSRASQYDGVWHVDAARRQGAESRSHMSEHVLFLQVESSPGQSALWRKRSTDTETGKLFSLNGGLLDANVFFLRQEISHLRSWSLSPSYYRTPFHPLGRGTTEASTSEVTWCTHPVECHAGAGKHRVAGIAMQYARRESDRRHNQGLQSCGSYLKLRKWAREHFVGRGTFGKHGLL